MDSYNKPSQASASRLSIPSLAQIFWGPLANRFRRMAQWRRQGVLREALQAQRRRFMRFETLEPRVLLSADLTHTVAAGAALDATLKVSDVDGAAVVQLVDNGSSAVLEAITLDQDVNVSVYGSDMGDRLAIGFDRAALAHQLKVLFDGGDGGGNELVGPDHAHGWQLSAPEAGIVDDISFVSFSKVQHVKGGAGDNTFVVLDPTTTTAVEGGTGTNTLVAADSDNAWTVSGADSGTLNGQDFSNIQNIAGGAGKDTFAVAPGGKLDGTVSGGAGENTLAAPDQDNSWTVSGTDSGTLNGQTFTEIQHLAGGSGQDTFTMAAGAQVTGTVSGGGGNDTLAGADQNNAWTISGANAGTLNGTVFADIENLAGGSGDDTFTVTAGGQLSGTVSGGDGNDTLVASDGDNTWVISGANAGSLNGQAFAGIENLRGGAGADAFVFAGGNISGSIDGGAGANTLDYTALAAAVSVDLGAGLATGAGAIADVTGVIGGSGSDTLKGTDAGDTWSITGQDAGSVAGVAFSGIENLEGGASADTFVFDVAGALNGGIDGGAGSDTVAGANKANLWNVNGTDAGTLNGIAYASVENLLGGSDNDTFALMAAGIVSGGIEGGLGADTVRGPQRKTVWRFTGQGKGNVGGVASFTGMEGVQGGTDDDVFAFDNGADFGGPIDGGGGADTLDYSAYTTPVEVDLAAGTATGASAFSGIASVIGGAAADTLKGPAADSTWTVSGANSGDVGGVSFSNFENLQGAANNQDTFAFGASGSLSGAVDGGAAGFDTLVLADGAFNSVVYTATGPDSGSIDRDGSFITFSGFEPVIDSTSGDKTVDITTSPWNTTTGDDVITISGSGGAVTVEGNGTFEKVTFNALSSTNSVTVNSDKGNDTILVKDLGTFGGTLNINAGDGNDTIKLDALDSAVTYNVDGGNDTDTVTFDASSGGFAGALSLVGSTLTGGGSTVTLQTGTIEKIDDANVNAAAGALKSLLDDLEKVSDAARNAVALGGSVNKFASQLPLLFGGDQNTLNLDNVVAFADAIDAVRADLHSYYNSLGASFTLNDLQSRIRGILDNLVHYAGSVVGDFAPTLSATDTANIKIALDGAIPESLSFVGGANLDAILGNINTKINANTKLAGKISAYSAGGNVAFKVNDPSIANFTVSCDDTDNAFSMLGLRTSLTMKSVEPALGSLTGAAGKLVQLADTWITFDSGTPKLSIDLPFNLSRADTFGLDFGKAARDLHGLNFDATAQVTATATVAADLNLGLTLDNAHTFDVTVNSFSAEAKASATLSADVSFGFLGAHVTGPITLDAGVTTTSPIHLTDLESGLLGSGSPLSANHSDFTADFQVSVGGGLNDGGSAYNPSGLKLQLLSGANPFDPSTFGFDKFTTDGDFTNLFNFNNLSPAGMITLLKKLAGSLDDAANSNVFSASNIPFVGGTISDALDLVKTAQKAILFDDGGDGTDDGTALVTDLNNALATATDSNGLTVGLSNRFLVQGDGTHVSLIATDGGITGFSASGLSAVGIDGAATFSNGAWRITGTPIGYGADGTLTLVVNGTDTYHVTVTGTGGNAKIGNDVPKLVNAAGAPTFHSAQEFASHLATLLGLAPSDIGANFDSALHALTFHLKFDAPIPHLTLPVNFNLDLGSFAGVKSDGTISITPDAGIDLTFGVDLGAGGGQLDDTKNLTNDLTQPVDIPVNPAFTGGDVYTVHDRLSSDASFNLVFGGHSYAVTVTKASTDQNANIGDLVSDLTDALKNATKDDGTTGVDLTSSFDASNDGSLLVLSSSSAFTLKGDSKLGFLSSMDAVSDGSKFSVKAANAVPDIVGNLPTNGDASFTIQMADNTIATIQVLASATAENRTVLDLLNDVRNALASSAVKGAIEVDTQGNALVFKSTNATAFTITAGTGADKLGLSGTHDSNTYDLVITLRDGSKYNVALKTSASPDQTACATIGDVKAAIARDTQNKVTVGFNTQGTALLLTDTTSGSGTFRVEAINGSGAGGKLGIVASDSAGPGDTPDGTITGAPIVGMPLADRLFIKAPGNGDPSMLHATLKLDTGSGISADANFGFVGVHLDNPGNIIDAGLTASLKDPNLDGRITLAEIAGAITTNPTSLVDGPTLKIDPQNLGHNKLVFNLSVSPSTSFFNPTGQVTFTVDSLIPPHVSVSADSNLDDLFKNFGNLSFDNILAVLTQLVVGDPNNPNDGLAGFLSAGPLGSFKIPLLNVSVSDLVSNLDKFTAALQSLQSNPAGSLQKLGEKLTEALGVPTTLSLESHKNLEFKFSFSDDFSKGLNLTIPANLLPTGFQLSGAAGLEFGAHLDLTLDFGLDLSSIDPLNPTALPSIYVYTGAGHTELSGTATIKGDDLNFLAGIGPLAVSIENGSAEIDGHFKVTTSDNDGTSDGKVSLTNFLGSLNADLGGTVSANLPVSFNGVSIGSIAIADFSDPNNPKPADLLTFDPTSNFKADLTLPDLSNISLFDDLLLSGQGIDLFLGGLQDLLSGKVFGGTKIPLIGDQLAQAGKFIEKLRNDFVAPYEQAIQSAKNAADNFAKPESNVISGVLFDLLGPGTSTKPGLGLLKALAGHENGTAQQDYVDLITNLDKVLAGQVPQDQGKIEWDFTLGGTYDVGPNINLDLGLPGLGLSMDGTVDVKLNWTLHLGIGFNYTDGFYLVIGDPKDPTDTNWKDLDVGLNVAFADGFVLSGQLGFLQLTATNHDLYQGNDGNFTDQVFTTKGTGVTADFAIDLTDGGSTSNHLPFADIGNLQVTPQVKAAAALEANLSLGLNPGVVGASVASGMPKVLADLVLDWSLDDNHDASDGLQFVNLSNLGDAMQAGLNLVDFSNLRLDVGSFVSNVLGPIVEKVKEATAPFQPIIDIITTPIPVISDLAGSPITLLDLAASFGHVDKGFIYALADIIDFVNSIPDPGTTDGLEIPLMGSDFKLFDRGDSTHAWTPDSSLSDKADALISAAGTLDTNLEQSIANMSVPGTGNAGAANKAAKDALTGMFSGKGSAGDKDSGFSFPLLKDPKQILYLLMGKNSDIGLVEYRMPKLDFEFDYSQFFPIFGPLGVSITGTVGLTIDFGFGYDTRGIREFVDSKGTHPELLVDGFYLTDLDTKGNDIPELTLFGGIAAAAELNLGIAQAGVAGGIGVEVDFNLHDNDHDGKVRLGEMAGNIYDEAVLNNDPVFAPLAIFDVTGAVFAQLSAFLKIDLFFWQFDQSWNITPKITLVDFSIEFGRVAKLATLSDSGDLRLNMGPYANSRLNGDMTDGAETFTVTHVSGSAGDETLEVSSPLASHPQTYEHVKKLIIEGGEGVDKITVNGVLSDMDISGGAGDDVIDLTGSLGDSVIHGDAGDDTITGGDGKDVIYGGL
ncbi:MAG: LEPR-XLL domain-containing protein, partial [Burkholderiales bacterium]